MQINENLIRDEYKELAVRNAASSLAGLPLAIASALVKHGALLQKEEDQNFNDFWRPALDRLGFGYSYTQNCLDLSFGYVSADAMGLDSLLLKERLIGKNEFVTTQLIYELVEKSTHLIWMVVPGIVQVSTIGDCQSPFHVGGRFDHLHKAGDKWFCDACQRHIRINDDMPLLTNGKRHTAKDERNRMSKALRFSVMERDNFTCRACGRNPRDHGVVLHVDHIIAIANGGKSELPNLHTLCQDCNLGKSAKPVSQMELWK